MRKWGGGRGERGEGKGERVLSGEVLNGQGSSGIEWAVANELWSNVNGLLRRLS